MRTRPASALSLCLAALLGLGAAAAWANERIVLPESASSMERLAGREVLRYVYLRTGRLPPMASDAGVRDHAIIIARRDQPPAADPVVKACVEKLKPQEYVLKTITSADGKMTWWIVGGDDRGTLYGAYRFAEKLGVRFYLHGDVIPDERLAELPVVNETGTPLFALRGVNPWGSHPFGFDAWSAEDYKAIFAQLAKMRMNFLGIHCYPEGHPYAEPTVWHGLAGDFDPQGRVTASYVSRYFNTLLTPAWGGYRPMKTGDYSFGGSLLFARDDWAPSAYAGHCPLPKSPEACNEAFNRVGAQFRDSFAFARQVGVKTCIGTEAPLILPRAVQDRLKAQGKNPDDPSVVREVYEGTFRRIMASHPLDYYWIWTPEGWTWGGNNEAQYKATVADIRLAQEALRNVKAPFRLATSGWVLGPAHDRAAFDAEMSKDVPMSAISRDTGADAVDPAFGRIHGREKWAIPWLESDNREGLAGVQLFAGRMRRDAADAVRYGCTGLMGLQWRTDILSPNVSALAQAAWDQPWKTASPATRQVGDNRGRPRCLPCDDFYADWALANFGSEAAAEIAEVFTRIDGKVPQVTDGGCPSGSLQPDGTPWSAVAPRFAFVDELQRLRPRLRGNGNLDRFDYWLNTFRYLRSLARVRCAVGAKQADEVRRAWAEAYGFLLASVNTPGGLAMVVNMENHPGWGPWVTAHARQPWPKEYQGSPRIIVPAARGSVEAGRPLVVEAILLDKTPPPKAVCRWRRLGQGDFTELPLAPIARGVYRVELPANSDEVSAIEYYIQMTAADGRTVCWPAQSPAIGQTVVVVPKA